MARNFSEAVSEGLGAGYDFASPKKDKAGNTAYQRYVEKFYGPDVTSHRDPLALARAATGAVENGLKTGVGFLSHAAAGLAGMPRGSSNTTPENRMYNNSALTAGLSSGNSSGSGYGDAGSIGSRISSDLQRDFGISANQAAGIVGNLGHETNGFRSYQEKNPVGGGRGGAGWAQWTGPRRTDFENYTKQNNLHPQSYEANYGFLKKELTGPYKGAIDAVKKANTVKDAVYAFEGAYEKAGVKNYASRMQYANNLGASYASSDTQVAQLQKDLNNRGANLAVDGIMGPLTRAAQQKYSTNTTYASNQQDEGQVRAGVKAPVQVASAAPDMGATRGVTIGPKRDVGITENPHTPAFMNPYTMSTGGANALGTAYNAYEAQRNAARLGPTVTPRQVQTQAVDATGYPPVQMQGAFNRPAVPQTPAFMNPYTGTTGGANAIQAPMQTARIPQARPPGLQWSQLQQPAPAVQAVPAPPANWTLADIQRWADQHGIPVTKAAGVLSDIGSRAGNALSEGSRSGMGYSGGNYSGGTYGGAGGRSISSGVGGAFKNR